MNISDSIVPEFDHEMATTRRTLERAPEDKYGWTPHEKSMTLGRLAGHIAEMPKWATVGLKQDSIDLAGGYAPYEAKSRADLLAFFDQNVAEARAAIAAASNEDYIKTWSLKRGDQVLMTMPKMAVVRTFVMNHIIHHRGQISVYLRLAGVSVPSIYGPSADEGSM